MTRFVPLGHRFVFKGLNLRAPADALQPGEYPYVKNIRPYRDTELTARPGLLRLNNGTFDGPVHSFRRLTDQTPWAEFPSAQIVGAGTKLYAGDVDFGQVGSGFSGNPLTFVPIAPDNVPEPWMYIADSVLPAKLNISGELQGIGLPAPASPATAALGVPPYIPCAEFDGTAGWATVGGATSITVQPRFATTILRILYDSGNTGWCTVQPTVFSSEFQPDALMLFGGGSVETVRIAQIGRPVASTGIAAIVYDAGNTGLCTIVPVAWTEGSADGPMPSSADRTAPLAIGESVVDRIIDRLQPASTSISRNLDLGVNGLVVLTNEVVRVLSVTVGRDGQTSFRCSTASNHVPGEFILGLPTFRAYTVNNHVATDSIGGSALRVRLSGNSSTPIGGLKLSQITDMGMIGTRPTQPDDEIHISVRVSDLQKIVEGRLYLDVDDAPDETTRFTRNYYMYVFRPSDLIAAIQSTNAGSIDSMIDAAATSVSRAQLEPRTSRRDPGTTAPDTTARGSRGGTPTGGTAVPRPAGSSGSRTLPSPIITPPPAPTDRNTLERAGVNQWAELRFKVRDLQRIGSDSSRTLTNVKAMQVMVTTDGSGTEVLVDVDSLWIGGSFGPDVGRIGASYIYTYRQRSTVTGAVGNPAPIMRSGVVPRREKVIVTGALQSEPQTDVLDWFRFGGLLDKWRYVGSTPNTGTPAFEDTFSDDAIATNPVLEFDNFQPWPIIDKPKSGTCNVCGTVIIRTSGDNFQGWLPGTIIEINGVVQQVYQKPLSGDLLYIVANAGAIQNARWVIQAPVLGPSALPALWGPQQGVHFACGDLRNPGRLYWTKTNQPEVTTDDNYVDATSPDEPLMNGFIEDGRSFVFSTRNLYEVQPTGNPLEPYFLRKTECGYGLWARWFMCKWPGGGVAFGTRDGIRLTAGGQSASITDDMLYPLFPHDGQPGVVVNSIKPPDMTLPTKLRLACSGDYLYFDYTEVAGSLRSLVYDRTRKGWMFDNYNPGILAHFDDSGPTTYGVVCGDADGRIYQMTGNVDRDGLAIDAEVWPEMVDGGQHRVEKQFGDGYVEVDPKGGAGVTVTPVVNGTNTLTPILVGAGVSGRLPKTIDVQNYIARDFGFRFNWQTAAGINPILYLWQVWYLAQTEVEETRVSDWDNGGAEGLKWLQGIIIEADTSAVAKTLEVRGDDNLLIATIVVNHNGRQVKPYAFDIPKHTHLMRLVPTDAVPWRVFNLTWRFQLAPELATTWWTQPTTHDLVGFQHLRPFMYLAYESADIVTLVITADAQTFTYTLPATGAGVYKKSFLPLQVMKGKQFSYRVTSPSGVRLYINDCELGLREWGSAGGYQRVRPFGDVSRNDLGARI